MPDVTILIPSYNTERLTRLCLRLIRKHTTSDRIRVIVIDNNSSDGSREYLKSLAWIDLFERKSPDEEAPGICHSRALDEVLPEVSTPYVLSIHTDTFVKRRGWLDFLLDQFEESPMIAGVGSWKLESVPYLKGLLKKIEYNLQSVIFPIMGKGDGKLEGKGDNFFYLRSHCAIYRAELIKKYNLTFSDGNQPAGKLLHKKLVDHGFSMKFVPAGKLMKYIAHINHATMILNDEFGCSKRSTSKGLRRMEKLMNEIQRQEILEDSSLDS
jgi:hypothetical protein